ncbi:hypothetical protein SLE2022_216020 [Rubroshorea leprosula]
MGKAAAESVEVRSYNSIKVHRLMCQELNKHIDRISYVFLAVEAARPGCTSGIQALCSLHSAMEKAKLLIQHCTESSKLYLAITADKILFRCEKIRNSLGRSMSQVQNMVPPSLAAKVSGIVDELSNAKFPLEPSEHEAGASILALLRQDRSVSNSSIQSEIKTLQFAALRLNITSPLALLMEKRSIKKLHGRLQKTDLTKKNILDYLLYLLEKYRKSIWQHQPKKKFPQHDEHNFASFAPEHGVENMQDEASSAEFGIPEVPEEFKCPMSERLFYDPIVIASGQSFERVWIEKWFNEGNQTCPVTHMRLENLSLTPNIAVKDLILKWGLRHGIEIPEPSQLPLPRIYSLETSGSIASFGSSIAALQLQTSSLSRHPSLTDCSSDLSDGKHSKDSMSEMPLANEDSYRQRHDCAMARGDHESNAASLSELENLSWRSQCKVIESAKEQLKDTKKAFHLTFSNSHVKLLLRFLEDAGEMCDAEVQKDGAEVLLAILSTVRVELSYCHDDVIYFLTSLLDSELAGESLAAMELLSQQQHYISRILATGVLPSILKVFDTEIKEFEEIGLKILRNLSINTDVAYHIVFLNYVPKLVSFLDNPTLTGCCIQIIKNLCKIEEAKIEVAEANLCMTSIAKLLEDGTKEEQEHTVDVLLSLCREYAEYRELIMSENFIQSLVHISANGNCQGQLLASELISLL